MYLINLFCRFLRFFKRKKVTNDLDCYKSKTQLAYFWSNMNKLGVCADWLKGSCAEDAWLSANSLYKRIKKNPLK